MMEQYAMQLFQELQILLPEHWVKLVFHGGFDESSYEFAFYVLSSGSNRYESFRDLLNKSVFSRAQMRNAYYRVYELCKQCREQMEGDVWDGFTFVLDNTGDFKFYYEYDKEDTSVTAEWKRTYLGDD